MEKNVVDTTDCLVVIGKLFTKPRFAHEFKTSQKMEHKQAILRPPSTIQTITTTQPSFETSPTSGFST
jgi:hypothetical protein